MAISSGVGLISGINYDQIISQLMSIERRPVYQMTAKQQVLQTQQNAFNALSTKLSQLQETVQNINEEKDFIRRTAQSSDTDIVTVSASSSSAEGSYSVKVLQMAQVERRASQGFVDSDTTAVASSEGIFAFKLGENGSLISINVDSTTTLNELRDKINAATKDVRASVINDGSGYNPYRLVINSNQAGADKNIIITTNNTSLEFNQTTIESAQAGSTNTFDGTVSSNSGVGNYTGTTTKRYVVEITTGGEISTAKFRVSEDGGITWSANDAFTTSTSPTSIYSSTDQGVKISFTAGVTNFAVGDRFSIDAFAPVLQQAQNSIVNIDGVIISRNSNIIDNALDGVTLTLKSADPVNTSTVSISNDNSNMNGLIIDFVNKYNTLIKDINSFTNYDLDTNVKGPLFGDSTTTSLKASIMRILSSAVPGLSTGLNSLAQIGIKLNDDDTLQVNTSTLSSAIQNNYENVKKIFAYVGTSNTTNLEFLSSTKNVLYGNYSVTVYQPATQGTVTGNQVISSSGISLDETLTFTMGDETAIVNLTANDKLADIVEKINNKMIDIDLSIRAYTSNDGKLMLKTVDYGEDAAFSVISNRSGDTSTQTGIGTSERTGTGIDVDGTINGYSARGKGQELTGATGTPVDGLKIKVAGNNTGLVGIINLTQGVGDQIYRLIERYTNSSNGLIKARTEGIEDNIESIGERIENYNTRLKSKENSLRAQFTKLETLLSQYQAQSQYLSIQIAQLSSTTY